MDRWHRGMTGNQCLSTVDLKARGERPPRPATTGLADRGERPPRPAITGLADRGERPPTSSQRAQPGATAPGHSPNGRARRPERRAVACALVSIPAAISGLSWRSCRRFGPGLVASRDCAAGQARAGAPDGAIGRTPCKPRDRTASRTPRPWKRCCSSTPEAPSGAPAFACPVVQSRDATNPGPRRRRDSRKSHDVPTEMRPEDSHSWRGARGSASELYHHRRSASASGAARRLTFGSPMDISTKGSKGSATRSLRTSMQRVRPGQAVAWSQAMVLGCRG